MPKHPADQIANVLFSIGFLGTGLTAASSKALSTLICGATLPCLTADRITAGVFVFTGVCGSVAAALRIFTNPSPPSGTTPVLQQKGP